MQAIFTHRFLTQGWPIWARYAAATLITLVMLALRIGLTEYLPSFPYLLFIPAIIVNAILFNRGTGLYTALLSAALAAYFFVDSIGNLQAGDPRQAIGLVVYLAISLTTAGIIEALHSTLHDLTQANRRLAASEREKDLLLQEASHRMKNDLAILTSLVKLQERAVQDPAARAALAATADRIQVMSRLHERLKRRETAAFVSIGSFIEDLCGDLKEALVGPRPILLKVDAQDYLLPEEQAVAVGLIVNELVTNSLKHAFPDDRIGALGVQFGKDRDHYVLCVADDGIGCPPKADPALSSGLGQRLIRSMAAQLGGQVTVEPSVDPAGTRVTIRFPEAVDAVQPR